MCIRDRLYTERERDGVALTTSVTLLVDLYRPLRDDHAQLFCVVTDKLRHLLTHTTPLVVLTLTVIIGLLETHLRNEINDDYSDGSRVVEGGPLPVFRTSETIWPKHQLGLIGINLKSNGEKSGQMLFFNELVSETRQQSAKE